MKRIDISEVASLVGSLLILIGSFYTAYRLGDPYAVRRGGALLVIYSLLFAFRAHVLDEEREALERTANGVPVPVFAPPKVKFEVEVDEDFRHMRRSRVMLTLSRLFRVHLIMAGVGEVLHGFGDLIYIQLFGEIVTSH
ncbi:hypothetical protein [Mesorhizobium sp. J428]|uniref:hypothetical protein n=1 Tax=Mesorhizobium sp. J428 TaxID=2898440 RepID=UPI002151DDB3|nr:hypothetical protein [Mesorhizobium sp. J428]MCR5858486.1 hypothetical protein [Mesorhizobium sp. J428]